MGFNDAVSKATIRASYEQDFYAWANQQADFLRAGETSELDLENLAEEMEAMGSGQKSQLRSRLRVLLTHLLKWRFQPEYRCRSWENTLREQRYKLSDLLEDSPSLHRFFTDEAWMSRVWTRAVHEAAQQTGVFKHLFPEVCPWTVEQILDAEFYPDE